MNPAPNDEARTWRRLWPLAGAQFLGVFNDHAFKIVAIFVAIGEVESYSRNAYFIGLVTAAYALPFLVFPGVAGFCADRFAKRNVVVLAKFAEIVIMLLGALCLSRAAGWGPWPLVTVMFLMALQSCPFSPAFNGNLPELFSEKQISRVNGIVGMLTFLAVICGMGGGIMLKAVSGRHPGTCGLVFSGIAALGFLVALSAVPGLPADRRRRWNWNWLSEYLAGWRHITASHALFRCILGDAWFVGAGTALQMLLLLYGKYNLAIPQEAGWGVLQLILAVGIGAGCFLAGRMSGRKVELGLVPYGAVGMTCFLLLAAWRPGAPVDLTAPALRLYPWLMGELLLAGLSAGFFIIPIRAYLQEKSNPVVRGSIIAFCNVICFVAILAAGMLMLAFAAAKEVGGGVAATGFRAWLAGLDAPALIVALALGTFGVAVYTFLLLPEFAMRFAAVTLTNTLYKLRIKGAEYVPEHGPALLVANHVSFVDGFLISACCSRHIRFLMHQDYYRMPWFHPFVKWLGFIEVPAGASPGALRRMFEAAQAALREGHVVCVFPEGKLTRNGVMDEFRGGFARMLPEDLDVPVIPVRLGMVWGSIFSYYHGRVRPRIPMELPHPAAITFGPPVPRDITPFALRQVISRLAAETEMIPRDEERPLHYQFAKFAMRHPFRRTVADADGHGVSNFALLVRAVILSREVRRLSDPERRFVGILLPNTTVTAAAFLGVQMADKVPAMLNFTVGPEGLEAAVRKANLDLILTSRRFLGKLGLPERPEMVFLEDLAKGISRRRRLWWTFLSIVLPHQELLNLLAPETHRDVFATAVLLFSSGATGSPKGVLLSHHNLNSDVYSFLQVIGWRRERDAIVGNLPVFHSFGLNVGLWIPLMTGTRVVYLPNPLDAGAVGQAIAAHHLTLLCAAPTFLQTYLRKCPPEQLQSLRLIVTGAEKLRPGLAERCREVTGLAVVEGYGCTECAPVVAINLARDMLSLGVESGPLGSVGMAMPGICVEIVDPATRQPLPPNTDGLMLVRGPNVMQGYLDDPEKTAAALRDGWYDTGDIARMDPDGRITITGRLSRFSKIGGEMVPHEGVEAALHEALGGEDRVCAVCGAPDPAKGERLLVFHTVLSVTPGELVARLRDYGKLPNLWIPRPENFREIPELPLLGSGKLDLKALQKMAEDA